MSINARQPEGSAKSGEAGQITRLLQQWSAGDSDALDRVFELINTELRRQAKACLSGERRGHTLQPTALVNELYMRLVGQAGIESRNRSHFKAIAARVMGQVLVDHARQRNAAKRGGGAVALLLDDELDFAPLGQSLDAGSVGPLLWDLERLDRRKRLLLEYRCFGRLTFDDCAELLGVSVPTTKRDWRFVRAWAADYLSE